MYHMISTTNFKFHKAVSEHFSHDCIGATAIITLLLLATGICEILVPMDYVNYATHDASFLLFLLLSLLPTQLPRITRITQLSKSFRYTNGAPINHRNWQLWQENECLCNFAHRKFQTACYAKHTKCNVVRRTFLTKRIPIVERFVRIWVYESINSNEILIDMLHSIPTLEILQLSDLIQLNYNLNGMNCW